MWTRSVYTIHPQTVTRLRSTFASVDRNEGGIEDTREFMFFNAVTLKNASTKPRALRHQFSSHCFDSSLLFRVGRSAITQILLVDQQATLSGMYHHSDAKRYSRQLE